MFITYDELLKFFQFSNKKKKTSEYFQITYGYRGSVKSYRYDINQFNEYGEWYIEKADKKNIILSLKKYTLNNKSTIRYHITIYPAAWNKDGEFHITAESLERSLHGFQSNVICSTFLQLIIKNKKVLFIENETGLTRPPCDNSIDFKTNTDKIKFKIGILDHTTQFTEFIQNYLSVVK